MQIQSEMDKPKVGNSEENLHNSTDLLADMRAKPSIGDIDEFLRLELEVGGLAASKQQESNCDSPVNQPGPLAFKKNTKAPFAHEASAIEPLTKNQNIALDYDGESLADIFQTKLSHQANSSDNPLLLFPEKPEPEVLRTTTANPPPKTYAVLPYQVKPTQSSGLKSGMQGAGTGASKAGASPGAGNIARKAATPTVSQLYPKSGGPAATPKQSAASNKLTKSALSIPKLASGRNPLSPTLPPHKVRELAELKSPSKRVSVAHRQWSFPTQTRLTNGSPHATKFIDFACPQTISNCSRTNVRRAY